VTTRILIADDHTLVAEGLRHVIEAQPGYHVLACAANGQEALRLSIATVPDVVLMDNAMPVLNGIEATRLIRRRCPATQVVMLSTSSDQVQVWRALEAGAMGYVLKTSGSRELVEAIRLVHAGQRYLSPDVAGGGIRPAREAPEDPLAPLSFRERQVLQMVAEGHTSHNIATMLSLSPKTVDTYRSRMMAKLGVRDFAALVKFAIVQGVTSIDY
jgi:DNA-binding NarL/FixJ family response regulator